MVIPFSERQKKSGSKLVVNWWRDRWRKKIDGKTVYFRFPNTAEGYREAVHAFYQSQRDQSSKPYQEMYETILKAFSQAVAWFGKNGEPEGEEGAKAEFELLKERLQHAFDLTEPPDPAIFFKSLIAGLPCPSRLPIANVAYGEYPIWQVHGVWAERFRSLESKKSQTVSFHLKKFLALKAGQAISGARAVGTYGELAQDLGRFEKWIGADFPTEQINSGTVQDYYAHLLSLSVGHTRRRNLFRSFKQFVRWGWRQDVIQNLPKNLNDRDLSFATNLDKSGQRRRISAEDLFTKSEIESLMKTLPARYKAYILLMLNCGFTQIDLATLRKDQIKGNRLVFQRTKTKRHPNPPIVNFKLWKETLAALKAVEGTDKTLLFTTEDGNPLVVDKLVKQPDETFKRSNWDVLGCQWSKWQKKKDVPQKSLKYLRKTGATKIEEKYRGLAQTYLTHIPTSMAGKHYLATDGKPNREFDAAISWLGQQFGLR